MTIEQKVFVLIYWKLSAAKQEKGREGDPCPRDFGRETAPPAESGVRLDQAIRGRSGAGVSNGPCKQTSVKLSRGPL